MFSITCWLIWLSIILSEWLVFVACLQQADQAGRHLDLHGWAHRPPLDLSDRRRRSTTSFGRPWACLVAPWMATPRFCRSHDLPPTGVRVAFLAPNHRALLRSQAGPGAGAWLLTVPSGPYRHVRRPRACLPPLGRLGPTRATRRACLGAGCARSCRRRRPCRPTAMDCVPQPARCLQHQPKTARPRHLRRRTTWWGAMLRRHPRLRPHPRRCAHPPSSGQWRCCHHRGAPAKTAGVPGAAPTRRAALTCPRHRARWSLERGVPRTHAPPGWARAALPLRCDPPPAADGCDAGGGCWARSSMPLRLGATAGATRGSPQEMLARPWPMSSIWLNRLPQAGCPEPRKGGHGTQSHRALLHRKRREEKKSPLGPLVDHDFPYIQNIPFHSSLV